MSFDNSFDRQDLYFGSGPEFDYYDALELELERAYHRERLMGEREEFRRERVRENSARGYGVDEVEPAPLRLESDGYGHGVQEQQVDLNDDDMSRLQEFDDEAEAAVSPGINFSFFRTDIRNNNWF